MSVATITFYIFMALTVLGAFGVLFTRNVFYGALFLIVCLLCIAGIYVLSFAEFVAATQILAYAGGILVVILFGIMLTTKAGGKPLHVESKNWFSAVIAGSFFFGLFIRLFSGEIFPSSETMPPANDQVIRKIGKFLLSDFLLPFELAGILLLVALVAAAVTAATKKNKHQNASD